MNRITSGIMAGVLSMSFAGAGMMVPAQAASVYVPQQQMTTPNVQTVQWKKRRTWHRHSRHDSRRYWRGHRGYDHYRRGYRRHGDLWFPLAAFATGAIISGAIANDRPSYSGNAHVQYCYNRYRSYRASDNTYQPYNGPRRQCRSPY